MSGKEVHKLLSLEPSMQLVCVSGHCPLFYPVHGKIDENGKSTCLWRAPIAGPCPECLVLHLAQHSLLS